MTEVCQRKVAHPRKVELPSRDRGPEGLEAASDNPVPTENTIAVKET
jgi:hypothetical protein